MHDGIHTRNAAKLTALSNEEAQGDYPRPAWLCIWPTCTMILLSKSLAEGRESAEADSHPPPPPHRGGDSVVGGASPTT